MEGKERLTVCVQTAIYWIVTIVTCNGSIKCRNIVGYGQECSSHSEVGLHAFVFHSWSGQRVYVFSISFASDERV